jgi:hypothetical protein
VTPPRPYRFARGALATTLLLVSSSAPAGATGPSVPPPSTETPPAARPASAFPPIGSFATPGMTRYGATEPLPSSPDEQRLRAAWSSTAAGSPALACTAREYATRFAADAVDPPPGVVAALAEHCGLFAPPPDVFAFTSPTIDAAVAQIEKAPAEQRQRPAALGAVVHPGGAVTVAVATPPTGLILDPLPRTRTPGARVAGQRIGGGGALWLYSAEGANDVRIRPVVTGADGRFTIDLPALAGADGIARHEFVRSEGPFFRSLAVLRQYPGAPPARYAPPPAAEANPGREALGGTLLAVVNARRQAAGRGPLAPLVGAAGPLDAWLDAVSSGASGAQPPPIVDDRAWTFARLRYAFAAGTTPTEAIDTLRDTPLGRVSLLDPEDTAAAFGVRPFGGSPGHDVVVVSLVRFHAPTVDKGRAEVLTAVNGRRQTTGLPPLQPSPTLDAVAQQLADQAQIDSTAWQRLVPTAGQILAAREVDAGAFGAGGATQVRWTPADLLKDHALLRKEMTGVGVGISVGPLPGQNTPHITVVYVVTDRLPPPRR